MKIMHTTGAHCLLFLAACLPAAAQADINPDHFSDETSAKISASAQDAQVRTLQRQLESYEQQLRAKAEQVENARQEAISAGIQGDGAGPFVGAYRQEQKEMDVLQAALTPQIKRTRSMIANLTVPALPSDSPTPNTTPVRRVTTVVANSNSRERRQTRNRMIASQDSSKLNPAAK